MSPHPSTHPAQADQHLPISPHISPHPVQADQLGRLELRAQENALNQAPGGCWYPYECAATLALILPLTRLGRGRGWR